MYFRTAAGMFGVGARQAEPNDLLVITLALNMPLILRQRENAEKYELLGPAYVHGIMEGEFIENLSKNLNQVREIRLFELN